MKQEKNHIFQLKKTFGLRISTILITPMGKYTLMTRFPCNCDFRQINSSAQRTKLSHSTPSTHNCSAFPFYSSFNLRRRATLIGSLGLAKQRRIRGRLPHRLATHGAGFDCEALDALSPTWQTLRCLYAHLGKWVNPSTPPGDFLPSAVGFAAAVWVWQRALCALDRKRRKIESRAECRWQSGRILNNCHGRRRIEVFKLIAIINQKDAFPCE